MLHVCLYQPEIPPNTGNIIRLCANASAQLHLIRPLGFDMDDKSLRRAGLDYQEWASVKHYDHFDIFREENPKLRLFACTTHGSHSHSSVSYQADDCLLLGPESRGLPVAIRNSLPDKQRIRIPMHSHSRSLNLSNACAIVLYEAWRQLGYAFGHSDTGSRDIKTSAAFAGDAPS